MVAVWTCSQRLFILIARQVEDLITIYPGKEDIEFKTFIGKKVVEVIGEFGPGVSNNNTVIVVDHTVWFTIGPGHILVFHISYPGSLDGIGGQNPVRSLYGMGVNILVVL